MNPTTSACTPALWRSATPRRHAAPRHERAVAPIPTGSSTALELVRFAATESKRLNRLETAGLLLLSGCAAAALTACFLRAEQFLAGWGTFENFVRTLLG